MSGAISAAVVNLFSMRTRGWIIPVAALAAALFAAGSVAQPSSARAVRATAPPEPVVIELFTAQGCADCPEANARLESVATEPGVIALTYAVDYWDYLGWEDTFARPEFEARQRAYQAAMRLRNVYTPQVVIDGRRQVSGAQGPAMQAAIDQEAARRVFPPEVEFRESGDAVGIGSGRPPAGGAEVWAVTFLPGSQTVTVEEGDNRGRVVRHVNVVRRLTRLGDWTGEPILLDLPATTAGGDRIAVLVQSSGDRQILTAAVR